MRNTTHSYQNNNFLSCSEGDGNGMLGERALWRAVITQALMDVSSNSKKVIDRVERARALAWFSLLNQDFIAVCALADLDHKHVLAKVKEAIARGCKWRNEPTTKTRDEKIKTSRKKNLLPLKEKLSPNNKEGQVIPFTHPTQD